MNKTELEKLSRQELIKACLDIKRVSEQKSEIIRGLEGCKCGKSDRVNYGSFDQCLDCGLPVVDMRDNNRHIIKESIRPCDCPEGSLCGFFGRDNECCLYGKV